MNIETYGPTFELVQQAEWVNSYVYSWRSPYIEAYNQLKKKKNKQNYKDV